MPLYGLRSLHWGGSLDFCRSLAQVSPVLAAGNQAYPGGRRIESICYISFGAKFFTFIILF